MRWAPTSQPRLLLRELPPCPKNGLVRLALAGPAPAQNKFSSDYWYPISCNNCLHPSSFVSVTSAFTLQQWFSTRDEVPLPQPHPRGHLAMFGGMFGCHSYGCATGLKEAEARHAIKHLSLHRTAPLSLCQFLELFLCELSLFQDSAPQVPGTSGSSLCLLREENAVFCLASSSVHCGPESTPRQNVGGNQTSYCSPSLREQSPILPVSSTWKQLFRAFCPVFLLFTAGGQVGHQLLCHCQRLFTQIFFSLGIFLQ